MAIINHVFYEGGRLPFSIVIVIDEGGIRKIIEPDLSSINAATLDIISALDGLGLGAVRVGTKNKRYLQNLATFPDTYGGVGTDVLLLLFQFDAQLSSTTEDNSIEYHDSDGTIANTLRYTSDLPGFVDVNESATKQLFGVKIFAPQETLVDPYSGPYDTAIQGFDLHLEYVFLDPAAGGYPTPALPSVVNSEGEPIIDYEVLISYESALFTEDYIYNKMAEYLNPYLSSRGFSTLTLR